MARHLAALLVAAWLALSAARRRRRDNRSTARRENPHENYLPFSLEDLDGFGNFASNGERVARRGDEASRRAARRARRTTREIAEKFQTPSIQNARTTIALKQLRAGDFQAARRAFADAVDAAPDDPWSWNGLAEAHEALERQAAAGGGPSFSGVGQASTAHLNPSHEAIFHIDPLDAYRRAVALLPVAPPQPTDPAARTHHRSNLGRARVLNRLGERYASLGRLAEAAHVLTEARFFAPGHARTAFALAGVRFAQAEAFDDRDGPRAGRRAARLEEAVHLYGATVAMQPNQAAALSNLGSSLEAVGRGHEAEAAWRSAARAHPAHETSLLLLGDRLARTSRAPAGGDAPVRKTAPATSVPLGGGGRQQEAVRCFKEVVRRNPRNAEAMEQLDKLAPAAARALRAQITEMSLRRAARARVVSGERNEL